MNNQDKWPRSTQIDAIEVEELTPEDVCDLMPEDVWALAVVLSINEAEEIDFQEDMFEEAEDPETLAALNFADTPMPEFDLIETQKMIDKHHKEKL